LTSSLVEAGLSPLEDHLEAPRGRGRLAGSPHAGRAGGAACGDEIELRVRLQGSHVAEAGFDARGCAAAQAAASATVELVRGRRFLEAARLDAAALTGALGGLGPERVHAATLAADALHRALGLALRDGAGRLARSPRRTLVAMSGGVDSAVAALLARERGDEVIAVTLELWADPENDAAKSCCSPLAVTGARALAHAMGIPHVTLDLRERFRAGVVDDFLAEHRAGRTPNPCVRCNGHVRFDAMLALAGTLGAARLATGHYARVERDGHGPLLRAGADPAKDQAYMLARLAPEELERLDFPLGALDKQRVREIARRAGLPVADRAESQDLCFLAGMGKERFLARAGDARPGPLLDPDGREVGRHDGQEHFTVGQRRGIRLPAAEPLYVLRKDASGRVWVGPRRALATRRVPVRDATLHRPGGRVDGVKLRYRSRPVACRVAGDPGPGEHSELVLDLDGDVDGVAPGQTACLLSDDRVVGVATISGDRVVGAPTIAGDRVLGVATIAGEAPDGP
jgi:tRNA-specific 2-thiouridylase